MVLGSSPVAVTSRIYCLILFSRRYEIVCTNASETLVSVILKKIYIIFIHKHWHYNLCFCYLKEGKISLFIIICVVSKFPKDIVPIVPISVITSISLKLHQPCRLAQNRFPEQKIFDNDRKEIAHKAVTSIPHRNDIEKSTWKTHRYFADFESRIHVEILTSNRYHNFHVDSPFKIDEISTNFRCGIWTANR